MAPIEESTQRFDAAIVEGPISRAVWKIAWPTMLQNVIAGLQGIVDHTLVGRFVGFTGNAAIGVSWQIFLVVIVFVASVFTGMGILVARFAGAGEPEKVNRVVFQGILAAILMVVLLLTPAGIFLAPHLLGLLNASPDVQAEALPYLRTLFLFSFGMLLYYMIAGVLRAAGDAQTPLRLGIAMTMLNLIASVVLIRGAGPIPAFGTLGAALGTVIASGLVGGLAIYLLATNRLVVRLPRVISWRPDWGIIRQLFRFGLPTGFQGIAMNLAGAALVGFVGSLPRSAEAQAAYAVGYTQLFSLVTWTSVGLMAATSAVAGQNLGAGAPERTRQAARTGALFGLLLAASMSALFLLIPERLLSVFGIEEPTVVALGSQLLSYLSISALFVTVALNYTGALQGTGDTRSPLAITIVSQLLVPIGYLSFTELARGLTPADVWGAILMGHVLRAVLSVARFEQGRWKQIAVDIDSTELP
ncbi:MAG TPA: MATE family efflux transporter [Vicinamibacteria bacterium]|nr:MATE family efflux transporter [Vicinamibacteria bacterium]